MKNKNNFFFKDTASIITGALSTFLDLKNEIDIIIKSRFEKFINSQGMVSREDFEALIDRHEKLNSEFKPQELQVIDESNLHAGHVGARPEGETHFRLVISSTNFIGKNRIDIQREIYRVLKDELNGPVHALTIKTI